MRTLPARINRRTLLVGGAGVALAAGAVPLVSAKRSALAASAAPTVAGLSHEAGRLSGGQTVVLTGAHLDNVTSVLFGARAATITATASDALTLSTPHQARYTPKRVPVTLLAADGSVVDPAIGYRYRAVTDVDRQMRYAFRYWKNYNSDVYGDFNASGGDCANFVSQTLQARGWAPTPSWSPRLTDWVYAPSLSTWLGEQPGATRLGMHQRAKLKVGDVAFFDWNKNGVPDHTMIVSDVIAGADGKIDVKLVGHNLDYRYRDLDTSVAKRWPGYRVWYYSIAA